MTRVTAATPRRARWEWVSATASILLVAAGAAAGRSAAAAPVPAGPLPALGIAMPVEGAGVCARFDATSVRVGQLVTLVYVDSAGARVATRAEVARRRATPCPDPFARSDASGTMVAYDLLPREPLAASFDALDPALVVASAASWSRGPDGIPRADLDGDGVPEEAHRCLVDEGWRFTLWSGPVARGQRRWAACWELGAEVDATCTAEESA